MPSSPEVAEFLKKYRAIPPVEVFQAAMDPPPPAARCVFVFLGGRGVDMGTPEGRRELARWFDETDGGPEIRYIWNRWRWKAEVFTTFSEPVRGFLSFLTPDLEWIARHGLGVASKAEEGAS